MEDLTGIRNTAKSKKEAGRNLHSWAHYQLQQFIAYKAKIADIEVENVKFNLYSNKLFSLTQEDHVLIFSKHALFFYLFIKV